MPIRRLTRSRTQGVIGGVCAGLADYFGVDVVLVRLLFVILSIAGAIVGGVIVYAVAWFIMPEGDDQPMPAADRRVLRRSTTDRQIAGVCGGMAEYFGVDSTAVQTAVGGSLDLRWRRHLRGHRLLTRMAHNSASDGRTCVDCDRVDRVTRAA